MQQANFVEGSLLRHIIVMSLSASVGLIAIFFVDLINILYISWLQDPIATAAVGFGGAFLFFTTAFGIGLSIAVSARVARSLGEGDTTLAKRRAANGLIIGGALSIVLCIALIIGLKPAVILMGASDNVLDQTVRYLTIATLGQPFLAVGIIAAAILRAYNAPQNAMMITIWGALGLAIADPILIFGFEINLIGAAWAIFFSRAIIAIVGVIFVIQAVGALPRPRLGEMRADGMAMASIAGAAILTQIATPVGQAIATRLIATFGEDAVAGMAISGRISPVAFAIIFALSGAIGPIIGQNAGAGRMDRVRTTFHNAVIFAFTVVLIVTFCLYISRTFLADIFHAQGITREILYIFCGPLSLLFFFNGVIFISNAACNNLGAQYHSTAINWARHTIGTYPFALWFGTFWGAEGVLIGQALGGVVFGICAYWLTLHIMHAPPNRNA